MNLCTQIVCRDTVEDKLNKNPDPSGTGCTPPYVLLHVLAREQDHLQHLADMQSTFWPETAAGTMCGGRGKRGKDRCWPSTWEEMSPRWLTEQRGITSAK